MAASTFCIQFSSVSESIMVTQKIHGNLTSQTTLRETLKYNINYQLSEISDVDQNLNKLVPMLRYIGSLYSVLLAYLKSIAGIPNDKVRHPKINLNSWWSPKLHFLSFLVLAVSPLVVSPVAVRKLPVFQPCVSYSCGLSGWLSS